MVIGGTFCLGVSLGDDVCQFCFFIGNRIMGMQDFRVFLNVGVRGEFRSYFIFEMRLLRFREWDVRFKLFSCFVVELF